MGKGSKRRPRLVTREQYERNWLSTFHDDEREQRRNTTRQDLEDERELNPNKRDKDGLQ